MCLSSQEAHQKNEKIEKLSGFTVWFALCRGIHGMLLELFTCKDPTDHAVVAAVAGSSLFSIVVDDEPTALKLLQHVGRNRRGSASFWVLDEIQFCQPLFAPLSTVPVSSLLGYQPKYAALMHQVIVSIAWTCFQDSLCLLV